MIAVLALSASPTPQASATPAGAQTPMRHVEFKVSYIRRRQLATETYGGKVATGDNGIPSASGPVPSESDMTNWDHGTISVDVLGQRDDVLYMQITENFGGAAYVAKATVDPAGLIALSNQGHSPIPRYLLPFFARRFGANTTFAPGAVWNDVLKTPQVTITTSYTVGKPEGAAFWLNELQEVKINAAQGTDITMKGHLLYDRELLVPLKGDFDESSMRKTMDTEDAIVTAVHFEKIFDSFDQAPSATATPRPLG